MEKEPQDKRESNTDYHPEVHARDVNNREVFKNNRLASQFLKNYTGISSFSDIEAEDLVNSIYGNAPKEIKDIFVKIIWSLLMKLNVPNEEAEEIVEQMRGGQAMGFLFENMDKMDIQAERRNTQRVIVVNVQGLTGKKVSYFSYPYSNVLYFGIETAGVLDIDSELIMTFANGTVLQFDFKSRVEIKTICANIQQYIL